MRASVTAPWLRAPESTEERTAELTRFNEAIDEALGESLQRFDERLRADQSVVLGILGHDLRTPLNVIGLSAGTLCGSAALGATERRAHGGDAVLNYSEARGTEFPGRISKSK